jgi:hypothetical protein
VLQRLVERAGVADGEDLGAVVGRAASRWLLALHDLHGEGHLRRRLDAGADDLAVALLGMDVALR